MRSPVYIAEIGFVIMAWCFGIIFIIIAGAAALRFVRWSFTPLMNVTHMRLLCGSKYRRRARNE